MKKRLFGLLATTVILLSLTGCFIKEKDIGVWFINDTINIYVSDWGVVNWDDYVDHNYKLNWNYIYHDNNSSRFSVYPGYSDGPIPVPPKDEYFVFYTISGIDDMAYMPGDPITNTIYTFPADSDIEFYLYEATYYKRSATGEDIEETKYMLKTSDGKTYDLIACKIDN